MTEEQVTFRDFAGALMGRDAARAAQVLGELLAVDADTAQSATAHFQDRMTEDPMFMQKAMGMRQAVESRNESELVELLIECFGLERAPAAQAASVVLARYR